jgi:glycosyltransferase involved in cell wall biosynthesis
MDFLQRYIDKQASQYVRFPDTRLSRSSIFVVIPCYNEPDLITTLDSLSDCYPPTTTISVLVVINDAENSPEEAITRNILTLNLIEVWKSHHPSSFLDVQGIYAHALPQKWAGVGWARKIGMDETIRQIIKNGYSDGIIVSLDADSRVLANYLRTIEATFNENPDTSFFTIHFEHPIDNQESGSSLRDGIIRYELHMRYYRNALQWCGYPHAIHTVGSSFAVRASAYVKQGGMNRRKAGEDFYFLHKLVLLGDYGNISSTTVFPASRPSDRVPFGTGAALKKWLEGSSELNYTYSLDIIGYLKPLFAAPGLFWAMKTDEIGMVFNHFHSSLQSFCQNSGAIDELLALKDNCSNAKIFEKRFSHLFNAFWILKYLNSAHESSFIRTDLQAEALRLLQHLGIQSGTDTTPENLLGIYRDLDRRSGNCR